MPRLKLRPSGCLLWLGLLFLVGFSGCGSLHLHRERKQLDSGQVAVARRLQGQMMQFADKYSGVLAQGLDEFAAQVGTPKARADAAFRKVDQASAAVTTASGSNPFMNLLDMVVLVTTTRISQEDYWVAVVYGEPARPLLTRLKTLETDIWNLAANYLSPDQLEELHGLIDTWQEKYPGQHYTAFQNFTQFASTLGMDTEQSRKSSGSIFGLLRIDPLSGIDPAVREIAQTRYLAERAIYYGQRLPILLQWRGESMFFNLSDTPEIQQILTMSERWTKTVEQLPTLVEHERRAAIDQFFLGVANERTNIINSLIAQEKQATNLLINLRETLEAATGTSTNLNDLARSIDTLLQNRRQQTREKPVATNTRPFDIREYGTVLSQAGTTATQMNQLLNSGDQSLTRVEQAGKQLATHIFVLALLFLFAIVVAMLIYRFLIRLLFGPKRTSGTAGGS